MYIQVGEGCTHDGCNKRWKVLRDKYVRELKKNKSKKSGDAGPMNVSSWPLFQPMSFLKDTIRHKTFVINFNTCTALNIV